MMTQYAFGYCTDFSRNLLNSAIERLKVGILKMSAKPWRAYHQCIIAKLFNSLKVLTQGTSEM